MRSELSKMSECYVLKLDLKILKYRILENWKIYNFILKKQVLFDYIIHQELKQMTMQLLLWDMIMIATEMHAEINTHP
jgi:hypothetical protein